MTEIWKIILETNTFNFVVMAAIFVFLGCRFKFGEKLQSAANKIKEQIEDAYDAKLHSTRELKSAFEKVSGLEGELYSIQQENEHNISNIKEKFEHEIQNKILEIQNNTSKKIELEKGQISDVLTRKTAAAAVEIAKQHLQKLLYNNEKYHNEFINKSIEELENLL